MISPRRKIANNIFFLVAGQGFSWIFASLYALILPAYLGPENIGILTILNSFAALIVVAATVGTRVFILREVARNPENARILVGPAVILYVVLGLVFWLIVYLFLSLTDASQTTRFVLYFIGASSVLGLASIPLRSALQGMDKMHYTLFETFIDKGAGILLAIVIVTLNLGLVALSAASLVTVFPILALYGWAFYQQSKTNFHPDLKVIARLFKGGFYFLIFDISFNVYLYLDAILLAALTNEKIVGYYSVPVRLFGSLLIAPVIMGQALLPSLSRLAFNPEEKDNLNKLSNLFLTFLICISLPVAVGTTILAEPFINMVYHNQFGPSIPVLILLGWTTVPTYLGIALYQILVSLDKQGQWAKLMVMAVFVNGGLNLALITYFQATTGNGAIGAGVSQFLTELLIGVGGIRFIGKTFINKEFAFNFIKSVAASLIMGVVIWPLREVFIVIPVIVGVIIYGIASIILFGLWGTVKQLSLRAKKELIQAKKLTGNRGAS